MPWSEWQAPFVTKVYGNETLLEWNRSREGMPAGSVGYVSTADPSGFKYGATVTDGTVARDGVQFAKNPFWAEYRDDNPPALDALTENVDYAHIPGTSQYVEYAPTDSTWLGWEFPDGQTGQIFRSPDPANPWIGEGSIGWQLDTSWPTEGYLYADPSQDRVWDLWTSYDPVPLLNPGNPGNVDFTITVNYNPTGGTTSGRAEATWYEVRPYMLVELPAWRYWIPGGVPPLRQKQRNDNLARGVYRARSTSSVQNSVRQKSYR